MDQKATRKTKRDAREVGRKKKKSVCLLVFSHNTSVVYSGIFKNVTESSAKTKLPKLT